ncbi:ATP-binding protein [Streptomyces sp. FH025]|uniref:ATP-binding protein n=1 Tax=Streptomyces sp. FH025 TaxID=2815937 RepID=UPI001A9EB889|nr:ATP-binding protein [Streptomyces sp. FH025]MBO1417795.1 ATP-binding protein [Streptomyces sp. FH025]
MESGPRIATTRFPAERKRIGELRRWATAAVPLLGLGLDDRQCGDVLHDVELILSELGTNAVLHGCGGEQPDVKLTASLAYAPGGLRVSVTDPGGGTPEYRSASDEATSGRGLRLVMGVVSRFGVESLPEGGKEIWAEIELPDPVRPTAATVAQIGHRIGVPRSGTVVRDFRPRPADGRPPARPALDRISA